jgi:putative ABC transport system permease protein
MWRDLLYGMRVLRRAPAFAAVAVLTLGLGIGAATAVFSVVNGVLLRPLSYPEPDRIVRLLQMDAAGRFGSNVSEPNFADWKSNTRGFAAMAEMSTGALPVSAGRDRLVTTGTTVSREFFAAIGVRPIVGREFVAEEQKVGGAAAVVVGDRLWRTRLGGRPLGDLTLRIEDRVHQVVGVMPPGFDYPAASEFWVPRELHPTQTSRTAHNFQVLARLADGVTFDAAQRDLSTVSRALKQQHGDGTWMSDAAAVPLREQLTGTARPALLLLFGASLLLLVIACLNVSNLQLARAATRRRELAVRLAVGAGLGRITRQLLAEATILSSAAALAGLALAFWGVRALVALQPANLPRVQDVHLDVVALFFAAAVAGLTACALGLATAWRASRDDLRATLTEGTRTMTGGARSERVRQALVVAQVALTIVLLAGASLLARSFAALMAVDPGYRTDRALVLDLRWPFTREPAVRVRRMEAQRELLARVRALPAVENAGLVNDFPLGSGNFANGVFLEMTRPDEIQTIEEFGRRVTELKGRGAMAGFRIASDAYFTTMGIRLARGRLFQESDGPDAPHVALISESLASTAWPNQDPIGRYIQFGNMDGDLRGLRIVGIVSDVRELSPERLPGPLVYASYRQRLASRFNIVVRTAAPEAIAPQLAALVRELDPELPVQMRTTEEALDRALAGRRFSLTLVAVFGVTALVLATFGVYGLIAYLVAARTREIGIRLALGAESGDVLRMVLGKGLVLTGVGLAVGLGASLGLTQWLKGMLFGISATDPIAFGGVLLLTIAAVLLASYLPARRAIKVTPVVALRME